MKRKWHVSATVVAGHYVGEFEAETGEEAIVMASEEAHVRACYQCARGIQDPELIKFVAESGDDLVENEPEVSWEEQARAAGWTPPKKASKKRT